MTVCAGQLGPGSPDSDMCQPARRQLEGGRAQPSSSPRTSSSSSSKLEGSEEGLVHGTAESGYHAGDFDCLPLPPNPKLHLKSVVHLNIQECSVECIRSNRSTPGQEVATPTYADVILDPPPACPPGQALLCHPVTSIAWTPRFCPGRCAAAPLLLQQVMPSPPGVRRCAAGRGPGRGG
jgi:hypothetical protein